jgi:hypothetical protein
MARKKRPGLSRERLRVFATVLEELRPTSERRLLFVLGYILGDVTPEDLARYDPAFVPPVHAAEGMGRK